MSAVPSNAKPRVLHVITGMTVGGAQTFLINLLPHLRAEFDVMVLGLYPGILRGEIEALGIPIAELDHRRLVSPGTLRRVIAAMRAFGPDIVHTHLGRADIYGRLAARWLGVRAIVSHSHNIDDWKKRPLFNAIDNVTLRWNRRLFAVSKEVRRFLIARGVPPGKIQVIYNGIDIEAARRLPPDFDRAAWRAQWGLAPGDKLITHIGRQDAQKAHALLIEGFDRFAAAHLGWHLLCVGGEGRLKNEVAAAAARAGACGRIHFAGHRRDIAAIMAASDVFILPSLWEGLPIVLLEAMAGALPIIATRVGGVPEMLEDGVSARLIAPGDAGIVAEALAWMAARPAEAAAMGARAREGVERRFDIREVAAKFAAEYRAALEECAGK